MVNYRMRHGILCMMVMFSLYMTRQLFTIAVLDMVKRNDTVSDDTGQEITGATCSKPTSLILNTSSGGFVESVVEESKVYYTWTESEIGKLQAAYFYGYMGTMLIGANLLLQYCGVFISLQIIMVLNSVGTLTFPLMTNSMGYYGALVSRFILGAVQGPTTSILAASMYDWALPRELTLLYAMINIGGGAGTAISSLLAGQMINMGISWEQIFYLDGLFMILPASIYFLYGDDAPEGSQLAIDRFRPWRFSATIPKKELRLIVDGREVTKSTEKLKVPWSKIILSKVILLYSAAWFCATFVFFAIQTLQARFFQYLSLLDIGFFSTLGSILSVIGIFIIIGSSMAVDRLCVTYERQRVRKLTFVVFGLVSVVLCCFALLNPCHKYLVVCMIILSNFTIGLILTTATKTIPNEIGGEYAGQIYAYSNTISNIGGVVCPVILGYSLDQGPIYQIETWYPTFILNAIILFVGALLFSMGNYELLDWAKRETNDTLLSEKK